MRTLAGCFSGVEPGRTVKGISTSACLVKKGVPACRLAPEAVAGGAAVAAPTGSRGICAAAIDAAIRQAVSAAPHAIRIMPSLALCGRPFYEQLRLGWY